MTFFIGILEWLASQILSLIAGHVATQITQNKQAADLATSDAASNQAALDKLNAAQTKADRIAAAQSVLNGL